MKETVENLSTAISGESHEFTSIYPEFAATANKNGSIQVAGQIPRDIGGGKTSSGTGHKVAERARGWNGVQEVELGMLAPQVVRMSALRQAASGEMSFVRPSEGIPSNRERGALIGSRKHGRDTSSL